MFHVRRGWLVAAGLALLLAASGCSDDSSTTTSGSGNTGGSGSGTTTCSGLTTLTVGGSGVSSSVALSAYDQYTFAYSTGTSYTVTLTTSSGDADLYIYSGCSTTDSLIGRSILFGTAIDTVTFTPTATIGITVQVDGYQASSYSVRVSSP